MKMTAKQLLIDVAQNLPSGATLRDAIHALDFRLAIEHGLAELDRGEGVPIEEVKTNIAAWAGK